MHSDVMIVGGGIIGCALAESLARAGRRVTLFEASRVGAEASSVAAGMLAPQIEAHGPGPFLNLSLASRDLFPETVARLEHDTGMAVDYEPNGLLFLMMRDADVKEADQRLVWQVKRGLNVQRLSREDLLRCEPALSPTIRGGLLFMGDQQVHSGKLTQAYAASARQHGVEIIEQVRVTRLRYANHRVRGIATQDGRAWDAPIVVDAAGSWARFDEHLPFQIPIEPVKGQILRFDDAAGRLIKRPIKSGTTYCVPRHDGQLLVGTTVEYVGFDRTVRAETTQQIHAAAAVMCPRLADYAVQEAWVNFRPATPDHKPLLGPTPIEGFYLATGHFRNGILLAPITAKLLAELLIDGTPSIPLEPFHLARFQIRGQTPSV